MVKVALFVENKGIQNVDVSHIAEGNPGIGGTENMFFLLAQLLSIRDNDIDVRLYTTGPCKSSDSIAIRVVTGVIEAYIEAQEELYDFFVIRNKMYFWKKLNKSMMPASILLFGVTISLGTRIWTSTRRKNW